MLLTEIHKRVLGTSPRMHRVMGQGSAPVSLPLGLGFSAGETHRPILHHVESKNAIDESPTCMVDTWSDGTQEHISVCRYLTRSKLLT